MLMSFTILARYVHVQCTIMYKVKCQHFRSYFCCVQIQQYEITENAHIGYK